MSQPVEVIRGRKIAFTYSNGDRPLDGYTIKRGIGVGGFGEVYFAISDAGKEVALKKIQRNLDIELRGVRQCLNLKHVNLISLWDICTNDRGESWVVMEYVPGESLRDVVERYPAGMPDPEIQRWFRSTAAGVQYLHNNGIIHRDLKPGNIFFDADEQVIKIGDYGLSKFMSCSRRSGQTESVGTFHYMAPEIGKGVYGKEIDIYALGVILYEMLTGRLPFDGESAHEIIMKHLTSDADLDPIPAEFRSVIFKALAKDPEDRYHSVDEMMLDFPASIPESQPKWDSYQPQAAPAIRPSYRPEFNPVVQPEQIANGHRETTYATAADGASPGIVFGPLVEVVEDVRVVNQAPLMFLDHTAPAKPEEPIAAAVRSSWTGIWNWWNNSQLGTPLKMILLVGAAIILLVNSGWLIPLGLLLGFLYLAYLFIRVWFLPLEPTVPRAGALRCEMDLLLRQTLNTKSMGERLTELTGSMLAAVIACAAFGLATFALMSPTMDKSELTGLAAWVTLTSLLCSWPIIICGKFWERSTGDNLSRRFWMLVIGLGVGAAAFGIAQMFLVDFKPMWVKRVFDIRFKSFAQHSVVSEGLPTITQFMILFAPLMAIVRWWRQADPARKTRLSIFRVGFCWLVALALSEFAEFPQVAASLVAIATAVAVQVSSPWVNRLERTRIRNRAIVSAH